jgi:outer membrane protein TolC
MEKYTHVKRLSGVGVLVVLAAGVFCPGGVSARDLTYEQALEIALKRSSRSELIQGNLDVAERKYFAQRVNFYLPEISLRGSLPAYQRQETYDYLPGEGQQKVTGQRTTTDLTSYIDLNQSLITGGQLTVRAYLRSNNWRYPQLQREQITPDSSTVGLVYVEEDRRLGSFDFTFEQPLLQPSQPKNELNNARDDLEIAKLTRKVEQANLKKEVAEAYLGALQLSFDYNLAQEKYRSAKITADVDSMKFEDGIVSEEAWLISASARLDAELTLFDARSQLNQQMQDLRILLDLAEEDTLILSRPEAPDMPNEAEQQRLLAASDLSIPIQQAQREYDKAKRAADFQRSSSGLQGTFSASYNKESGSVETTFQPQEDLNLDTWGVSLEFTYPLWDGGATGASIKAAELEAERKRIELERAQKAAKAEIRNLINGIDVSYRKLDVLKKQIELANNRLEIAQFRLEDGQISEVEFLEAEVAHLEAQRKYVEELKNYLIDMYDLDAKFIS